MSFTRMSCQSLIVLASSLTSLVAQSSENIFQHDPVEYYLSRGLPWIVVTGMALLLYSLVVHRGRLVKAGARGVLVFGVIVFPLMVVSAGMLLVFERAEKVAFCASCHLTMQPYVDDMRDPESESLAAIHYKNRYIPSNQCYECHTSYGLFGTVEAKMAGTIDVFKYYTGTYELPITMRHPYPQGDCLKCHSQAVGYEALHEDFEEAILSGEVSCMECHGEEHPAHPISE